MKIGGYFLLFLLIALVFDGVTGFVSTTGIPSNVCSTANKLCDQISYGGTVLANSSFVGGINSLTSPGFSPSTNDMLVVVSLGANGGFVTSVSDLAGTSFSRAMRNVQGTFPQNVFEIWTGSFKSSILTDTVTVNWNITAGALFFVSDYHNAVSVGNATGTGGVGTTGTFTIETEKSGSWIVGGASLTGIAGGSMSGLTCSSAAPVPGTGLVQRMFGCGTAVNGDTEDNATVLPNNTIFTYTETFNVGDDTFSMGAIELVAGDREPQNPNFNIFCNTLNGLCVTSQYFINVVGTSTRPNALNQVLTPGTTYCTGVTSSAITTLKTDFIYGLAGWGGVSLNTTGLKILVQFYVTTTAPPTTFGSCSPTGFLSATATDYFPVSGTLSAGNAFDVSISSCVCLNQETAGTYFGNLAITPYIPPGTGTGHVSFDQVCNQVYSSCFITLQEQK